MTITPQLYDTSTLLGVYREVDSPANYWLDLCFPNVVTSDDEFIDFERVDVFGRKLAPFVLPMAQGRPVYSERSEVKRFRPAYIKAKDVVHPTRTIKRRPGELLAQTPQSPAQRYNAIIADIMRAHRSTIERRWEWMAAQAIIHGQVTIEGEGYPKQVIDFGRDAGHTISLGSSQRWGDQGVSILDDILAWSTMMRKAKFGGIPNRITVGADVWDVMRKDQEILKQLDLNTRGTNADIVTGLRQGLDVEYVGRLSPTLEVWVYSEYYEVNGSPVSIMSSKDIVMTSPAVMGVRAFGAIIDKKAGLQPMAVFSKMWDEEDPSATQVMTQSAPLMVPVNPNATLKATVIS